MINRCAARHFLQPVWNKVQGCFALTISNHLHLLCYNKKGSRFCFDRIHLICVVKSFWVWSGLNAPNGLWYCLCSSCCVSGMSAVHAFRPPVLWCYRDVQITLLWCSHCSLPGERHQSAHTFGGHTESPVPHLLRWRGRRTPGGPVWWGPVPVWGALSLLGLKTRPAPGTCRPCDANISSTCLWPLVAMATHFF